MKTTRTKAALRAAAVVTAVLAMQSAIPAGASAHGSQMPGHRVGSIGCVSGGRMTVRPPGPIYSWNQTTFRNAEQVNWSPDLYRWNGARWVLYNGSRPWYTAVVSSYGLYQSMTWPAWQAPSHNGVLFVPYDGLGPGTYIIKNYIHWLKPNVKHVEWSSTCRFY